MATVQRRIVHKQFNSPIGMYSDTNIKETLDRDLKILSNGAVGIEFETNNPKLGNLANSAVLRMLEEEEATKAKVNSNTRQSRRLYRNLDRETVLKINRYHHHRDFSWPPKYNQNCDKNDDIHFNKTIKNKHEIDQIRKIFDKYKRVEVRGAVSYDNISSTVLMENESLLENDKNMYNQITNIDVHIPERYHNDEKNIFERINFNRHQPSWPPITSKEIDRNYHKTFYLPLEKYHSGEYEPIKRFFDANNNLSSSKRCRSHDDVSYESSKVKIPNTGNNIMINKNNGKWLSCSELSLLPQNELAIQINPKMRKIIHENNRKMSRSDTVKNNTKYLNSKILMETSLNDIVTKDILVQRRNSLTREDNNRNINENITKGDDIEKNGYNKYINRAGSTEDYDDYCCCRHNHHDQAGGINYRNELDQIQVHLMSNNNKLNSENVLNYNENTYSSSNKIPDDKNNKNNWLKTNEKMEILQKNTNFPHSVMNIDRNFNNKCTKNCDETNALGHCNFSHSHCLFNANETVAMTEPNNHHPSKENENNNKNSQNESYKIAFGENVDVLNINKIVSNNVSHIKTNSREHENENENQNQKEKDEEEAHQENMANENYEFSQISDGKILKRYEVENYPTNSLFNGSSDNANQIIGDISDNLQQIDEYMDLCKKIVMETEQDLINFERKLPGHNIDNIKDDDKMEICQNLILLEESILDFIDSVKEKHKIQTKMNKYTLESCFFDQNKNRLTHGIDPITFPVIENCLQDLLSFSDKLNKPKVTLSKTQSDDSSEKNFYKKNLLDYLNQNTNQENLIEQIGPLEIFNKSFMTKDNINSLNIINNYEYDVDSDTLYEINENENSFKDISKTDENKYYANINKSHKLENNDDINIKRLNRQYRNVLLLHDEEQNEDVQHEISNENLLKEIENTSYHKDDEIHHVFQDTHKNDNDDDDDDKNRSSNNSTRDYKSNPLQLMDGNKNYTNSDEKYFVSPRLFLDGHFERAEGLKKVAWPPRSDSSPCRNVAQPQQQQHQQQPAQYQQPPQQQQQQQSHLQQQHQHQQPQGDGNYQNTPLTQNTNSYQQQQHQQQARQYQQQQYQNNSTRYSQSQSRSTERPAQTYTQPQAQPSYINRQTNTLPINRPGFLKGSSPSTTAFSGGLSVSPKSVSNNSQYSTSPCTVGITSNKALSPQPQVNLQPTPQYSSPISSGPLSPPERVIAPGSPRGWAHVDTSIPVHTGYTRQFSNQQNIQSSFKEDTSSYSVPTYAEDQNQYQPQATQAFRPVNYNQEIPQYTQQQHHQPQQQEQHYQEPQQQYQPSQQQPYYRQESPGYITLRNEAPVSQKSAPVYSSQPAAASYGGGSSMRGDEKWPPATVKAQSEFENEARRRLAQGPTCRPRRANKDYSQFFAQHTLNSTYPGYRAPPGTQHHGTSFQ